jgi:predicted RNA polymerase sigma factor
MCFYGTRFSTHTNENGDAVLLAHQDRSRWNRTLIRRGIQHLQKSAAGDELTRYHIEAGIASAHCLAPSYPETDWPRIVGLYEQLQAISPSPFVSLNHAVAVAEIKGPQVALDLIDQEIDSTRLAEYHLYHAVRAHLLRQLESTEADAALKRAAALAPLPSERRSLQRRSRNSD